MNLYRRLLTRAAQERPIRIGLIGAGKFGTMFLHQARRIPGLHVAAVADLALGRVRETLARIHWPQAAYDAQSLAEALRCGTTFLTEDAEALLTAPPLEVIIECTGQPAAGIRHARRAIAHGKHVVMVTVEADVLAGPLLAREAAAQGVVYSLAYGDQPALVCELVDTLRAAGFTVVAAGKGTKYLPHYHASTPDTVWEHYGLSEEAARRGGLNPQMFNSFLDGTKSAIEMAAIANATQLTPPEDGLLFPPAGIADLPRVLKPQAEGGVLAAKGVVEVVSSLRRDGSEIRDHLRWGVYAVVEGETDYVRRCFAEYGISTDESGCYAALWRPYHFVGLELAVSIAAIALRREPSGVPLEWRADVVAVAKRDLRAGEVLDGEGGYLVWGKCLPAARSRALGAVPIGLAHGIRLTRDVRAGSILTSRDAPPDPTSEAFAARQEMMAIFG